MSKGTRVTFYGLDELNLNLRKQPKEIRQEAGKIVRNVALKAEKKAAALAPVDTGYLKQEIQTSRVDELTYDVIAHAEYSVYQEFGTRKTAPQPFMTPAVRATAPFLYQSLNNLVKKGLL